MKLVFIILLSSFINASNSFDASYANGDITIKYTSISDEILDVSIVCISMPIFVPHYDNRLLVKRDQIDAIPLNGEYLYVLNYNAGFRGKRSGIVDKSCEYIEITIENNLELIFRRSFPVLIKDAIKNFHQNITNNKIILSWSGDFTSKRKATVICNDYADYFKEEKEIQIESKESSLRKNIEEFVIVDRKNTAECSEDFNLTIYEDEIAIFTRDFNFNK